MFVADGEYGLLICSVCLGAFLLDCSADEPAITEAR
jgi:hypothetical protein